MGTKPTAQKIRNARVFIEGSTLFIFLSNSEPKREQHPDFGSCRSGGQSHVSTQMHAERLHGIGPLFAMAATQIKKPGDQP
jgi:hypothetical protein